MFYSREKLLYAVSQHFGSQRNFFTASSVIGHPSPPSKAALLRFDVERAVQHHTDVAQHLGRTGIPATFFFHTRRGSYDAEAIRAIQDFGHEIGYHHECLDRCHGDFGQARDLFLREVDLFRKAGFALQIVCGHGEAGLPRNGYKANWDIFERYPDLLQEAGLRGEVYLWIRQTSPFYASDTFKNYRRFWDILAATKDNDARPAMIVAHLHRWRSNPLSTLLAIGGDLMQYTLNRVLKKRGYILAY